MKAVLKVVEADKSKRGLNLLSNGHTSLEVPTRSKLLDGLKLEEGDSYEIELKKVTVKRVKRKVKKTAKPIKKKPSKKVSKKKAKPKKRR